MEKIMSIVSVTGHRPDKLGGYSDAVYFQLLSFAEKSLLNIKPDRVISGMALGWDQAIAEAAAKLKIPFWAAIPFKGQECKWPVKSQDKYHRLLSSAERSIIVCDGSYCASKMQKRNEWMVNNSDLLVALWNGASGGTANCVAYAKHVNKDMINLWEQYVNACRTAAI
jgi:uncharacterized phage-like protein YoqJ